MQTPADAARFNALQGDAQRKESAFFYQNGRYSWQTDTPQQQSAPQPASEPAAAPAAASPAPQPGPAVQALQRMTESPVDAGAGWETASTPGQVRPGLGERLRSNRPSVFSGRIY